MARLASYALTYTLLLWALASGVRLLFYLAASVDDFRDIVRAAFFHSGGAMWIVPAVMLIAMRQAAPAVVGIVLLANATRSLATRFAPQALRIEGREERRSYLLLIVNGAIAVQGALIAWLWGHPLYCAALSALTALMWTVSYRDSGAMQSPSRRDGLRTFGTLILATLLTTLLLQKHGGNVQAQSFAQTSREVVTSLSTPPASNVVARKMRVTSLAETSLPSGVPGVILRPKTEAKRKMTLAFRSILPSIFHPVTLRFTGDYYLFAASLPSVPSNSTVLPGTPLEQVYSTVNGTRAVTEAYQKLDPPFDLTPCKKIQLVVRSGELAPIGIELWLVTLDGTAKLGTEIIGLSRLEEEAVEFAVPNVNVSRTTGLRIRFRRVPVENSQSMKLKIQTISLLPK